MLTPYAVNADASNVGGDIDAGLKGAMTTVMAAAVEKIQIDRHMTKTALIC
jgi:hypothetical protein